MTEDRPAETIAMPSPFPGMDPYLEGDLWTTVHAQLAAEVVRQLSPHLRPRYVAWPHKYYVMDSPETVAVTTDSAYPDVSVADTGRRSSPTQTRKATSAPVRVATLLPREVPHVRVEIRDAAQRRLVTGIEFLSPTNKKGEGRKKYLRKRRRLLLSDIHLIELDLLRKGRRPPTAQPLPPADYYAFLVRADDRWWTDAWPIRLEEALPKDIKVPLLEPDPDVLLDLQEAFSSMYDVCGFAIDYQKPPDVPLTAEQAQWADRLLREAGLRK